MTYEFRWGVIGTGFIAGQFAQGMREEPQSCICAVTSRSREHGEVYAKTYGVPAVYTDAETMIREEHPDVVYLAVPNDCHYDYIMKLLDLGVPVLSEKPIVDNMRQHEEVFAKADEKGLFLMEGMWTRCFPAVRMARKWISGGLIGAPLTVKSFFDIAPPADDWQIWKAGIRHSGGSLRDVGIYAIAMANLVFPGKPVSVHSVMQSNGEVDEAFRMLIDYGEGRSALAGGAFNQVTDPETEIAGTKGSITIGPEFWHPKKAVFTGKDGRTMSFEDNYRATGFQYEIHAVTEALAAGKKEVPYYTREESRLISQLIEDTRKQWGILYQADRT